MAQPTEQSEDRPVLERADDTVQDETVQDETVQDDEVRRRRRPTGEAPPLPRAARWRGYRWTLIATVAIGASLITLAYFEGGLITSFDERASQAFASRRSDPLISLDLFLNGIAGDWTLRVLRWATVLALVSVRRFRHLFVFLAAVLLVEYLAASMNFVITRPRPMVDIVGPWEGFSHPSRPIAGLAVTLIGMRSVLIPRGRWRDIATNATGAAIVLVALARIQLGVDHVSDTVVAAAIGAGIGLAMFRLLTPAEIFPVVYKRGETAHLDITGERKEAIRVAVADQLGLRVDDVELHGADASAGSTPLKISIVENGRARDVFGKLYTNQHVRSDRSYKLFRTLAYGRLEDESPFTTVRRLVEYEDHMSRVMRDSDIPVPDTLGIVEITPDREYLFVTEFLPGEELTDTEISEDLIDDGLHLVQKLWAGGIAHRDVKPANIMVVDGHLHLIDTAFSALRPSPWRQAVDLAAMMLVLALGSDAETVYARACEMFSEDELAEAFAATSGFAIPGQLQRLLDDDGRDLLSRFRELAPDREPIRIVRWGRRRVGLAVVTLTVIAAIVALAWTSFTTAGLL